MVGKALYQSTCPEILGGPSGVSVGGLAAGILGQGGLGPGSAGGQAWCTVHKDQPSDWVCGVGLLVGLPRSTGSQVPTWILGSRGLMGNLDPQELPKATGAGWSWDMLGA